MQILTLAFIPLRTAITKTTNAPSAPASVGVAQPKYMEPNIIIITEKIGIVAGKAIFSLNEYILVLGPISGFKETILTIIKP